MSVREVSEIDLILSDLRYDNFEYTNHARLRMRQRNISLNDITSVADNMIKFTKQQDGSYRIIGLDTDNDELTIVCVYRLGTLILTMF